jgi:exosortase
MYNYIIWLLVIALYLPVLYSLYSFRWEGLDYTHAYFILPISLWLTWRQRMRLRSLYRDGSSKYSLGSLSTLFAGILMFIWGWREEYWFITVLSLIPVLYGLTIYLYGVNVAKALSFPILFLLLLVPPPLGVLDSITMPMRHGTSVIAEEFLKYLNYPIRRQGLLLTIGYNDIFMGQPCSGFRSLITMFSLVSVYIYISKGGLMKKLILASLIIPVTLFGNFVRVITLCLITFYFGEETGQGFFHNFSGIVIFIIAILGMIGVEFLLDKFSEGKAARQNA